MFKVITIIVAESCAPSILCLCTEPPTDVTIIDGGVTPVTGEGYTLSCIVTGDEKLNSTVTYQWMKYNDTAMHSMTNSGNLSFSPLSLSNSGNYSCNVVINSRYLSQAITASSNLFGIRLQGNFILYFMLRLYL